MLSDEEQERTVAVCITLLRHLMHWTAAPAPDPKEALRSTPASHARAVLQLLARLTKKHSLAQKARPILQQSAIAVQQHPILCLIR